MTYTSYEKINSFETIYFVGGTDYTFRFNFKNQAGSALDVSTASLQFKLSEYGNYEEVILNKTGSLIDSYSFKAYLGATDTINLDGVFSYQIRLVLADGQVIKPGQGIIYIIGGME